MVTQMEKIISLYVVSSGEGEDKKSVNFATKTRAKDATELLARFGVVATTETVKKTIKID
jgi:hypothetical protein